MLSTDGRGMCPTKPDTGPLKNNFVTIEQMLDIAIYWVIKLILEDILLNTNY